jgi:hypothetical protein
VFGILFGRHPAFPGDANRVAAISGADTSDGRALLEGTPGFDSALTRA